MSASRKHIIDRLDEFESRWFVLRTANRREKLAAKQLHRDGVTYFLPLKTKRSNYNRKVVERELCILPSYIFVKIKRKEEATIFRNPYVNFVRVGADRLDIAEEEIELLRRIVGLKTFDLDWELADKKHWQKGQAVELIGGPLTGTRGTFLSCHNKSNLFISLGLLPDGKGLKTMVPTNWIRPLASLSY